MSTFNCNTCHVMCASVEEVKDHYRTDLHVFNSKRRAKNLKPVSAEDFDRLAVPIKNPAIAIVGSASASASSSSKDKMNSTNPSASWNQTLFHRTFNNNSDKVRQEKIALMSVVSINDSKDRMVTDTVTNSNISDSQENINVIKSDKEDDDDDDDNYEDIEDEDEETPMDTKKQLPQLPLGANISIFDNKQFENIELCISHMVVTNGFFIPDSEYISDLEGLLEYLGEKVKLGGMCLYCQKRFSSGRACQHHMIQKSHCKLAYEENVDLDEYEDFYDFSSTFEDCSDNDEEDAGVAQVSSIGELILPDGRTLGHRDFRQYYKQHYRPEDNRPSVMAQKREELLKISTKYNDVMHSVEVITHMDDVQVKSALVKHYKTVRKANILEQRGMMGRLAMDQQREYKSKVAAARSSATTTKKIRDYHKTVM